MSYKWDKMTKTAWNNSEVMQEFEKNLLETIARFQKLAVSPQEIKDITPAIKDIGPAATEAGEGLRKMDEALSADDQALIMDEADLLLGTELPHEDELEITEEDQELAKEQLLADLREMAREAAFNGNKKLAYKIERAIDEVIEEL